MLGELYHLVDRDVILDRARSLEFNSPERMFLLSLLDNTVMIHKINHNWNVDTAIQLCKDKEGFDNMATVLQKCKI